MKPTPRILLAALAGATLAAAATPALANADVASSDGTTMYVRGDDRNESIVLSMTGDGRVEVNADEAGAGCERTIFDSARCPLGGGGVVVTMAGGNDHVTSLRLTEGMLPDGALRVDLGAGDDDFKGADGAESVVGGAGNDTIAAAGGDDAIDAGDGNDTIDGGNGRDTIHAGAGDDLLDGGAFEQPAADTIDGGPGNDKAEGWNIPDADLHPPVTVTVDGSADDGRPGEGDNVIDVERVTSYVSGRFSFTDAPDVVEVWANQDYGSSTIATRGGNDTVTGGNAAESIDGGAGDDRLEGGFGDDAIVGGPGRDTIIGDKSGGNCGLFESCSMPIGNDTIDARDGEADSVICGVGADKVLADAADTVAPDCETVERTVAPPVRRGADERGDDRGARDGRGRSAGGAKLALAGRISLAKALARGVSVRVRGAAAGRRLALTARSGKTVVARGTARAGKDGGATVTLRFTGAGKRKLRGARSAKLTIAGAGLRTLAVTLKR